MLSEQDSQQVYTVIEHPGQPRFSHQVGLFFLNDEGYTPTLQDQINACAYVVQKIDDTTPLIVEPWEQNSFIITALSVNTMCDEQHAKPYVIYNPETKKITFETEESHYYACTMPQKHIQGCTTCQLNVLKGEATLRDRHCNLLQMKASTHHYAGMTMVAGEWSSSCKHSPRLRALIRTRTKLGNYTCVAPAWTTSEDFAKFYRPIEDHDFSHARIQEVQTELSRRALQGHTVKHWLRANCPTCVVQNGCKLTSSTSMRTWCAHGDKTRQYTEKEATDTILKNSVIPYTDTQLQILLAFSGTGDLPVRHNRCIIEPTFRTYSHDQRTQKYLRGKRQLGFVFLQRTASGAEVIQPKTFKEILKVLSDKLNVPVEQLVQQGKRHQKLTKEDKAMLMVAASITHSPTRCNGFGPTQYPVLSVGDSTGYGASRRWRLDMVMSKGRRSWFYEKFASINDVFMHYQDVPLLPEKGKED